MALAADGPAKTCPRCGERKPRREFYALRKGAGVYARSLCKPCDKASVAVWRAANPARVAAIQAATHARRKLDPERAAIRRDQGAQSARRRRGNLPRLTPLPSPAGGLVDAAPFAAWLRTLEGSSVDVAWVVDMQPRQVRGYLSGERTQVLLDTVDRACLAAGVRLEVVLGDAGETGDPGEAAAVAA